MAGKYTGNKLSRFKAMMAVGLMTGTMMMGAMAKDVQAMEHMKDLNSGNTYTNVNGANDIYNMDMGNGSTYNPMTGELTMGGITHNLQNGEISHINGIPMSEKYDFNYNAMNSSTPNFKAAQRSDGTTVVGLEKNTQKVANNNINKRTAPQQTYNEPAQPEYEDPSKVLENLLPDDKPLQHEAAQPEYEQQLKDFEEIVQSDLEKNSKTGNDFRDMLNARNADSPYYVKDLDKKEKEATEKAEKSSQSKEDREIEDVLEQLL